MPSNVACAAAAGLTSLPPLFVRAWTISIPQKVKHILLLLFTCSSHISLRRELLFSPIQILSLAAARASVAKSRLSSHSLWVSRRAWTFEQVEWEKSISISFGSHLWVGIVRDMQKRRNEMERKKLILIFHRSRARRCSFFYEFIEIQRFFFALRFLVFCELRWKW